MPTRGHWFPMSRAGRFIGYGFMAVAALLAVSMRRGAIEAVGPFPAVAIALFSGMVGVMLVFTDLMVRGLYAQIGTAKAIEGDKDPPEEGRGG